jgi:hypothetical protein
MQARGGDPVGFGELLDGIGFPVVKTWLAVLLGEFVLEPSNEFYVGAGIFVELKRD